MRGPKKLQCWSESQVWYRKVNITSLSLLSSLIASRPLNTNPLATRGRPVSTNPPVTSHSALLRSARKRINLEKCKLNIDNRVRGGTSGLIYWKGISKFCTRVHHGGRPGSWRTNKHLARWLNRRVELLFGTESKSRNLPGYENFPWPVASATPNNGGLWLLCYTATH